MGGPEATQPDKTCEHLCRGDIRHAAAGRHARAGTLLHPDAHRQLRLHSVQRTLRHRFVRSAVAPLRRRLQNHSEHQSALPPRGDGGPHRRGCLLRIPTRICHAAERGIVLQHHLRQLCRSPPVSVLDTGKLANRPLRSRTLVLLPERGEFRAGTGRRECQLRQPTQSDARLPHGHHTEFHARRRRHLLRGDSAGAETSRPTGKGHQLYARRGGNDTPHILGQKPEDEDIRSGTRHTHPHTARSRAGSRTGRFRGTRPVRQPLSARNLRHHG